MNPVVLIATHNRIEITTRNIESLLRQSVKPLIVVICTNFNEAKHYMDKGSKVLSNVTNHPLGLKWASGIYFAKELNPNPLIITGSDDILGPGFIENACRLIDQGNHFIGIRRWWQHHKGRAYYCQYRAKDNLPLGGARCYSAEMLKAIDYKVFDTTKDRHLDDLGWHKARKSGLKCLVLEEPEREGLSIHAIKGDWPVMNPFNLHHKNIRLLKSQSSEKVLPEFFNNGKTFIHNSRS